MDFALLSKIRTSAASLVAATGALCVQADTINTGPSNQLSSQINNSEARMRAADARDREGEGIAPASVQLLVVKPDGTTLLVNTGPKQTGGSFSFGLARFPGSWKKVGSIVEAREGAVVWTGSGQGAFDPRRQVHGDPQKLWPDLQRRAAQIGANAVIYTGEDASFEGSAGDGSGLNRPGAATIGEIWGTAVRLADVPTLDSGEPWVLADGASSHGTSSPGSLPFGSLLPNLPYVEPVSIVSTPRSLTGSARGDRCSVVTVRGDQPTLQPGGRYLVEGTYHVASAQRTILALSSAGATGIAGCPQLSLPRGDGRFYMLITVPAAERADALQLGFYPESDGQLSSLRVADRQGRG